MVAPNDILGYHRLVEKIGAGGLGEVWKAEDTRLGRTVASDQEAIARMRREARTAAQIHVPNIATIDSIEEIGERLFIGLAITNHNRPHAKQLAREIHAGNPTDSDVQTLRQPVERRRFPH